MAKAIDFLKWLVFTNLYIAVAAVCFQLITATALGLLPQWNWGLSLHTLFSTSLVYQFSRWNYHRHSRHSNYHRDELYLWLDKNPNATIRSILVALTGTGITLLFLHWSTIKLLFILGLISVLYPIKLKFGNRTIGLRSVPFLKIFLIAFTWAGISVWVPLEELGLPLQSHGLLFAVQFIFILFITLPFDMVDMKIDEIVSVKTLPHVLGHQRSKYLTLALGMLVLPLMLIAGFDQFPGYNHITVLGITGMTIAISIITYRLPEEFDKWKVMAIYDGSMILYFLITLATYA